MQKAFFLVLFLMSMKSIIYSQTETSPITNLNDLFELADLNSKDLKVLNYRELLMLESVSDEKKKLLPTLDASLSFSYNGDGSVIDRNFSNSIKAEIPGYGNNFALEATQIIYAGGAIKSSIKKAELSHSISKLDTEKARQEIRFVISGYYLEILKLNNQKRVLEQNIAQTKVILEQIKTKYNEGTMLSNNVTRYELQLQSLELSLLQINNRTTIVNNDLVKIVSLPQGTKLRLSDQSEDGLEMTYNSNSWQNIALSESPLMKQLGLKVEESKQNQKLANSTKLPQVFAFAFNKLDGPIMIEIPTIDKNFNYWAVGVGIKYNISSLYKSKSKIKMAKLATQLIEEDNQRTTDNLLNTIDDSYISYLETVKVYETQLKAIKLATENYEIIRNRYLNDLVLITEMLDAENSKLDAELKAINAQINIIFHYYQLKNLTGTL